MNTFVFYIAFIICYLPMYVSLTLLGLSVRDWQTEWEFAITALLRTRPSIYYCIVGVFASFEGHLAALTRSHLIGDHP